MGNARRIAVFLCLILYPSLLPGQSPAVVISEIMAVPKSGAPEWFELYNAGSLPVNLRGWRMSDATGARPLITAADFVLPPGGYAVIAKDTSIAQTFPETLPLLIVAGVPSLNNGGDDLCIYRPDTSLVERISYSASWGGGSGISLERRNPDAPGNDALNWGSSTDPRGGTPGARNSIRLRMRDLSLSPVSFDPPSPRSGEHVEATIAVHNAGTKDADLYKLEFYEDANGDGLPDPGERLLERANTFPLRAGGTDSYRVPLPAAPGLRRIFLTTVLDTADEHPEDNSRADTLRIDDPPELRINEIMYAPADGEPEWIELVNIAGRPASLRDLQIADNSTLVRITDGDTIVPPKGFAILARSGAVAAHHQNIPAPVVVLNLPSLNNGGDEVRLFDRGGRLIDSIRYAPAWGGAQNGRSLERRDATWEGNDPANWSSSTDAERSTPGRENSDRIKNIDAALAGFFRAAEGFHALAWNAGADSLDRLTLSIFADGDLDSLAEEGEQLCAPIPVPALGRRDSVDLLLPVVDTLRGLHLLIARLACDGDEKPGDNTRVLAVPGAYPAGALAINEIQSAPLAGDAEYVEYVNLLDEPVNLARWSFADRPSPSEGDSGIVADSRLLLPPGGYLVLASDSSILRRFPYLAEPSAERVLLFPQRPGMQLNNDEDDCLLFDASGARIDSIRYSARWHNPNFPVTAGLALERLNPRRPAQDAGNWSSSVAAAGGTPGRRNSVYTDVEAAPGGANILTLFPNPFSPDGDGVEDVCTLRWNFPAAVPRIRISIFDARGRLVRSFREEVPGGTSGEKVWDGRDAEVRRLPAGIYVVLLEGLDLASAVVRSVKKAVVVR